MSQADARAAQTDRASILSHTTAHPSIADHPMSSIDTAHAAGDKAKPPPLLSITVARTQSLDQGSSSSSHHPSQQELGHRSKSLSIDVGGDGGSVLSSVGSDGSSVSGTSSKKHKRKHKHKSKSKSRSKDLARALAAGTPSPLQHHLHGSPAVHGSTQRDDFPDHSSVGSSASAASSITPTTTRSRLASAASATAVREGSIDDTYPVHSDIPLPNTNPTSGSFTLRARRPRAAVMLDSHHHQHGVRVRRSQSPPASPSVRHDTAAGTHHRAASAHRRRPSKDENPASVSLRAGTKGGADTGVASVHAQLKALERLAGLSSREALPSPTAKDTRGRYVPRHRHKPAPARSALQTVVRAGRGRSHPSSVRRSTTTALPARRQLHHPSAMTKAHSMDVVAAARTDKWRGAGVSRPRLRSSSVSSTDNDLSSVGSAAQQGSSHQHGSNSGRRDGGDSESDDDLSAIRRATDAASTALSGGRRVRFSNDHREHAVIDNHYAEGSPALKEVRAEAEAARAERAKRGLSDPENALAAAEEDGDNPIVTAFEAIGSGIAGLFGGGGGGGGGGNGPEKKPLLRITDGPKDADAEEEDAETQRLLQRRLARADIEGRIRVQTRRGSGHVARKHHGHHHHHGHHRHGGSPSGVPKSVAALRRGASARHPSPDARARARRATGGQSSSSTGRRSTAGAPRASPKRTQPPASKEGKQDEDCVAF